MKLQWNKTTLVLIFWILFFIIDLLKKVDSLKGDSERFYIYYLPGYLVWVLMTFPMIRLFNWTGKMTLWKRGLFLVFIGILIGGFKVLISWSLSHYIIKLFKSEIAIHGLFASLSNIRLFFFIEAFIIAWVVLIVMFMIELYQKYREQSVLSAELEKQLATAQLQTLKMQLRPHFLFNANNVISMLVRKGENEKAIKMIAGLSDLLRTSLERENHQLITLKEELELLQKYLKIELLRFEDQLEVKFNIQKETEKALVPNFILQPLLENAFKHGVSKSIGKALISISAQRKKGRLKLEIFNSGPGLSKAASPNVQFAGIGISNTQQRLKQLYKEDFFFKLSNAENGVKVEIEIPLTA